MDRQRATYDILDRDRPSPLTWAHTGGLSVAILRQGEVDEDRWAGFVRSFERASSSRLLLLVLGAVDLAPARRRTLTHAIGDRRVAGLVDSVIGRGVLTALSWSGVALECFSSSHIRDALAALDLESEGESLDESLDVAARLIEGSDRSGKLRDRLVSGGLARAARSA